MTVLGDGVCVICGHPVVIKETKAGLPSYICGHPNDGGCGGQVFARYPKSAHALTRKIKKWRDAELRARYNGQDDDEPAPDVAGEPNSPPKPKAKAAPPKRGAIPRKQEPVDIDERPEPPVNVKPKGSFWDKEIF